MNEEIIEAVKTEMKNNNISIAEMCRRTSLSRQTLDNILNGRRSGINLGTLRKLCDAVGLEITLHKK